MSEEKKQLEKQDKARGWASFEDFRHIKIFGIALIIISFLLVILVSLIIGLSLGLSQNIVEREEDSSEIELTITQEESAIINVVEKASPSVVSIAISEFALRSGEGLVDEINNIGTGFVVDSNGIIVTNQHVVSDISASYKIITNEGKEYEVIEILRDDINDIAILKIDATSMEFLELGDSNTLLVGQTVIAIGTPLGELAGSVTTGIISGLKRSVTTSSGWFGSTTKVYEDVIQTDAAVNPGNSGGPLISTEGKVIGVNFATTSNADNISFALPIDRVKQRLEEYITYGKFIRPYVGVSYRMISEFEAMYYDDVVAGALVVTVDPTGPASKADIRRGDIIVKVEDKEVTQSFAYLVQSLEVGSEVSMELWREGRTFTVDVTLQEAD
jgi:serine protease Do